MVSRQSISSVNLRPERGSPPCDFDLAGRGEPAAGGGALFPAFGLPQTVA
jgi:hypothetical protein